MPPLSSSLIAAARPLASSNSIEQVTIHDVNCARGRERDACMYSNGGNAGRSRERGDRNDMFSCNNICVVLCIIVKVR